MGREIVAHLVFAVRKVSGRLEVTPEFGGAIDHDFFVAKAARHAALHVPNRMSLRERELKMPRVPPRREDEGTAVAARDADGRGDLEELIAQSSKLAQRKRNELRVAEVRAQPSRNRGDGSELRDLRDEPPQC